MPVTTANFGRLHFHHVAPNMNITHGLEDSAQFVVNPMFYDYCGINVVEDQLVG